jgi:hypothetical protein
MEKGNHFFFISPLGLGPFHGPPSRGPAPPAPSPLSLGPPRQQRVRMAPRAHLSFSSPPPCLGLASTHGPRTPLPRSAHLVFPHALKVPRLAATTKWGLPIIPPLQTSDRPAWLGAHPRRRENRHHPPPHTHFPCQRRLTPFSPSTRTPLPRSTPHRSLSPHRRASPRLPTPSSTSPCLCTSPCYLAPGAPPPTVPRHPPPVQRIQSPLSQAPSSPATPREEHLLPLLCFPRP